MAYLPFGSPKNKMQTAIINVVVFHIVYKPVMLI
jgi:hypothetical protein